MLALCSMLLHTYYAHFNAGIIRAPLCVCDFMRLLMFMMCCPCSVVGSAQDLEDIAEKLPDTFKVRFFCCCLYRYTPSEYVIALPPHIYINTHTHTCTHTHTNTHTHTHTPTHTHTHLTHRSPCRRLFKSVWSMSSTQLATTLWWRWSLDSGL